jgi:hypothetical protein
VASSASRTASQRAATLKTAPRRDRTSFASAPLLQQLRQLGDVGGDAPGFVAGEEVRRRATTRLLLEIDVGERLPVGVADDDGLCRQEASAVWPVEQWGL